MKHNRLAAWPALLFLLSLPAWSTNYNVAVSNPNGDFSFDPKTLNISVGDTVTWQFAGGTMAHNVVAPGLFRCAQACDGEGGNGDPSSAPWTVTRTFANAGTVNYYCEVHRLIGMTGSIVVSTGGGTPPPASAVEYYYDVWNFYFETSFADEIAALDGGAFGGVWKRTGQTFNVWSTPAANPAALPTCRFFSTIFDPKSSHFYTPYADECASLKAGAAWQFESIAFYIQLPDANGLCPPGTIPLYRAYNDGMGGAPNHRYTTSLTIMNQMAALGWKPEGSGTPPVFACVAP